MDALFEHAVLYVLRIKEFRQLGVKEDYRHRRPVIGPPNGNGEKSPPIYRQLTGFRLGESPISDHFGSELLQRVRVPPRANRLARASANSDHT